MSKKRKYPKVTGWWVYAHLTPDYQFIYLGYSGGNNGSKQCSERWQPIFYKTTALWPYIEQYGWDNLIHIIIQDGLTEEQAEKIEGALIRQAKADGWCINQQGSGGEYRDNPVEYKKQYMKQYNKQYYQENKDKRLEYQKQYREDHRDEIVEYHKQYDKQYNKQRLSTPEGKIYNRVNNYNTYHPDRKLITPMEAKYMYELTGYIPDFIKNNDLL